MFNNLYLEFILIVLIFSELKPFILHVKYTT